MIQQTIKAVDADKPVPKVNVTLKMLTISWEDITEETVQKRFAKTCQTIQRSNPGAK